MQNLSEIAPVSDNVNGDLYRAMSEITYMTGNEMLDNRYTAYALYYFNESGNYEAIAYLTNKYIGRLYSNGCYKSAKTMLMDLAEKTQISSLPLELQSAYYLSLSDIAQMMKEDDSHYLSLAQSAIELMAESGDKELNLAKANILRSRDMINDGNFDDAEKLMKQYSENDDFGLGQNQVYVVCDFKIPYYEIMAKLALHKKDYDNVDKYSELYINNCDEYSFRTMKLHFLHYIAADTAATKGALSKYKDLELKVMTANLDVLAEKYGEFLLSDIETNTNSINAVKEQRSMISRHLMIIIIISYISVFMFCIVNILISYMNKDGLTKLSNRKEYEHMRLFCEKKKVPYCLLMIDIDNFKKINDTFGHERGDEVLRAISAILRKYSGRGIFSYRYGGEELCVMLLRVPEKRSRAIAEEIRKKVDETVGNSDMHITVSIGVGCSINGENIFREADMKLYEAKETGKNKVC